jgi:hypothetical protein
VGELAVVALLTVAPGFGALALLGTFRSYPKGLPGFWDFPSATIGDGLLLPALLTALYFQIRRLPHLEPRRECLLTTVGFVVGAAGGVVVPLSWVLNSRTRLVWLLPRANHYNLAGWVHAGYLTVVSGVIVSAWVLVCARARSAPRGDNGLAEGWSSVAITVAVGTGLAMITLIGRDAVIGSTTVASATTIGALAVIGVGCSSSLLWGARGFYPRRAFYPALLVVAFITGMVGLILKWPPRYPGLTLLAAVCAGLAAAGATAILHREREARWRWLVTAVATTLLIAGLIRADSVLTEGRPRPLLWIIAGVVCAVGVLALSAGSRADLPRCIRYGLLFGYVLVLFFLAMWIRVATAPEHVAAASLALADMAFDVMVFALIQSRFGSFSEADALNVAKEYVDEAFALNSWQPEHALAEESDGTLERGDGVMSELSLLGFAVGFGLLALLSNAAGPMGLNHDTAAPAGERIALMIVATFAVLMLAVFARARLDRWHREEEEPRLSPDDNRLRLPRWYWQIPVLSVVLWAAAFIRFATQPMHLPLLSALVGCTMFVLYLESLTFSSFKCQTLVITTGQVILATTTAAAVAFGDAWFVGVGLWQGDRTLTGSGLAVSAALLFVGNLAVFVTVADSFAAGLPSRRRPTQRLLARESVSEFASLDGVVFGVDVLICVMLPVFAAARDQQLHGAALKVVASLLFLPGLLTAVIWGMENLRAVDRLTRESAKNGLPTTLLLRAGGNWNKAAALDRSRVRSLHHHWTLQWYGGATLMLVGLSYLALTLLRT